MVARISMSLASGGVIGPTEGFRPDGSLEEYVADTVKALHKIEIHFGSDRSSLHHKLMAALVTIWESGKRLHGGGDEKMYWCGYNDCGKPFSTDNFAYLHAICPECSRELHLDPDSKQEHLDYLARENLPVNGMDKLPIVVGEKLMKQTPPAIAGFLAKTWYELGCHADIYLKFHPKDIRLDKSNLDYKIIDKVELARAKREPVIYSLARILKDTATGGDLKSHILAMITA